MNGNHTTRGGNPVHIPERSPPGAKNTLSIARRLPPEVEANKKFLKFGHINVVVSEALNREPAEWRGSQEKTLEAVSGAMEKLEEKRFEDEEIAGKYGALRAFLKLAEDESRFKAFEGWSSDKERDYSKLARVYAELGYSGRRKIGMGVTQDEVLAACSTMRGQHSAKTATPGVIAFPELVGSKYAVEGAEMAWGELEMKMFNAWLQAHPEALSMPNGELAQENEKLLREVTLLNGQNRGLTERLRQVNIELGERTGQIEEMKARITVLEKEVKRIEVMQSTIAKLESALRLSGSMGGIAPDLTEDDVGRPTIASIAPPAYTPAQGVVEEGDDSGRFVPPSKVMDSLMERMRQRRKSIEEPTQDISLEGATEVPVRNGVWRTEFGRAIDNIFIYGVAGKGNKKYPPKHEEYAKDVEYTAEDRAYRSWYGQAGRAIRETLEATRRNWKKITAVATGAVVLAAAATGYFMYAPVQQRPEEVALRELQRPAVAQVATVDDTVHEAVKKVQKVGPKPEPLAKPLLADVLAKHGLELGKDTHMVQFYKGLEGITGVQERYILLAEALGNDAKMEGHERRYVERPILEMYMDFLNTAMEYAQLEGQDDAEKAGARELGEIVSKRLANRIQQKRIKEKLGKEAVSEMGGAAARFDEFAAGLPDKIVAEEEGPLEVPVVTAEQLEEMKKAGETPESGVIILPDKSAEKLFDMAKAMESVVPGEFRIIDTSEKVNDFARKAGKVTREEIEEKFLVQAHLTSQIIEHGLEHQMSEKRIMFMHLETMNAAILFAMEEGQGMTAKTEALNAFDFADKEVRRILGYKKMKDERKKRDENITWLRNRAEELKNEIDNYNENKDKPIPLPGSPALENGNGAPTAMPEKVTLDRYNKYAAMQTVVFCEHGLSIMEHPLKVYQQMKGMKINHFDRFMILDNLAGKVVNNPLWMDGLSKADKFEMLRILASYLREAKMAANEPKNWREEFEKSDILVNSLAIDVGETVGELRKLDKAELGPMAEHLRFQMDQATYKELGEALEAFERMLNYEYRQKARMVDTEGE